jgi:uncharacterized protein (TIGR00266 family)
MNVELIHRPAYAMALVHLTPKDTILAEGGAMVSMDGHVQMTTSAGKAGDSVLGGLVKGIKRLAAGESFFQNRFTSPGGPGRLWLAPVHVGDIVVHDLRGTGLILQSSAFLCSDESITTDAKWGGGRAFFGGEALVMLKAQGTGSIAFNSFGGIRAVDVTDGFTVDTGHIVAFEDTLEFELGRIGSGFMSLLLSGEGLVCRFRGRGRLWIQSRNPRTFGAILGPKLPAREH